MQLDSIAFGDKCLDRLAANPCERNQIVQRRSCSTGFIAANPFQDSLAGLPVEHVRKLLPCHSVAFPEKTYAFGDSLSELTCAELAILCRHRGLRGGIACGALARVSMMVRG